MTQDIHKLHAEIKKLQNELEDIKNSLQIKNKKIKKNFFLSQLPKKIKSYYLHKKMVRFQEKIQNVLETNGLNAAEKIIYEKNPEPKELANYLTHLAKLTYHTHTKKSLSLGYEAIALSPDAFRKKWLAFRLFDAGKIEEAYTLLQQIPLSNEIKPSEKFKIQMIQGTARLAQQGIHLPDKNKTCAYSPVPKRLLYVAASALPYHSTGYTIRTHNVLKGLIAAGWDVLCITRPGYPDDREDSTTFKPENSHYFEDVHYEFLAGPHRRKTSPDEYFIQATDIIADKIREFRPTLVQAASNYENSLPVLLATRTLGVPFIYEVRGLWEFTTASKISGYEESERFALEQNLEQLVATHADLLFTLGKNLANELINRGVKPEKIHLAPNAINPSGFPLLSKDKALTKAFSLNDKTFVIGYAGSIVGYEGLDDLITAFYQLRNKIPNAKVIIVGDGDTLPALRKQAKRLNLGNHIHFMGKLPHHEVTRYYSIFDMLALPRKPHKVCQLVTPLKPLEAMCMGIPMVVSDVAALREMVEEGETALVHRANDPNSLASAILQLALDPVLRKNIAKKAQEKVLQNYTWEKVCQDMTAHYTNLEC